MKPLGARLSDNNYCGPQDSSVHHTKASRGREKNTLRREHPEIRRGLTLANDNPVSLGSSFGRST